MPATDKWGNEVENASGMMAAVHRVSKEEGGAGTTCMGCHVPTIGEQLTEGMNWVTGNYINPLEERDLDELVEARGLGDSDEILFERGLPQPDARRPDRSHERHG